MNKNETLTQKPFPRQCPLCRTPQVFLATVTHHAEIEHDGRVHRIVVKRLKTPVCKHCDAVLPDSDANRAITREFLRQAQLLAPEQIREYREALGLTQKSLAATLGVAEASVSRWETGGQIQQRSLDNLLRIFFGYPEVRERMTNKEIATLGLVGEPVESPA